jgi:sugar/nucleoside kinase (ribokinase family)
MYLDRFEGWLRLVDIVKVSEEDLAWLYPHLADDEVIAAWHAAGVALVVVTRGERGAVASTPLGSTSCMAPPVTVVDTVGAGDAFMSGALAHLHERGLLSRDALRTLEPQSSANCCEWLVWSRRTPVRGQGQTRHGAAILRGGSGGRSREVAMSRADLVERARALAVLASGTCWASPAPRVSERARSRVTLSTSSDPTSCAGSDGRFPPQQPHLDHLGTAEP